MKYTALSKINQPLDFRSPFTYSGRKEESFDEMVFETLDNYEVHSPRSVLDYIASALLICCSGALCLCTMPFSAFFTFKMIHQYERLIVYRNGRLCPPKGPGIIFILPCVDKWTRVDMRTKAFNVPPTNIRSTDGCIISIGAIIHFRIRNPVQMSLGTQDVNHAVRDAARASMANILSKKTFHDIKTKKQFYSLDIQADVNLQAREWGIEVSRVEMSDLTLILAPPEQHSMFMPMHGAPKTPSNPSMDTLGQLAELGQHFLMQNLSTSNKSATSPEQVPVLDMVSTEELFHQVQNAVNEKLVEEVGVTYQIDLPGSNGGSYYLDLKNMPGNCAKGQLPGGDADVTLTLSAESLHKLLSGKLTPYNAYSSGELQISGKLGLAMRLDKVLEHVHLSV